MLADIIDASQSHFIYAITLSHCAFCRTLDCFRADARLLAMLATLASLS